MKTKEKRRTPVAEVPLPPKKADERRGLWIVVSGRMKQYGDDVIERPGQIIRQQYLRNDDVLLKHNYVRLLDEHDDMEKCQSCGAMFLGSVTAGPYKAHLAYARHDLATLDLDTGLAGKDGRVLRVGDIAADPDSNDSGDWDLETEGAPSAGRLEEEAPGGVRLSMGSR